MSAGRPARPPRLAQWLLAALLPPCDRAHALGDLHEEYAAVLERRGRSAADRWYWGQLVGALPPLLGRRIGSPGAALPELAREARLAARSLVRRPALALVGVGTLGLGIGAATAVFSVADAVLFRPLPYAHADRLVAIWDTYDAWRDHEVLGAYWDRIGLSWPEFVDLRERQTSFEDVAIYGTSSMALTGDGDPRQVTVGLASASLFRLLGVEPHSGRSFAEDEVGPEARRLAILSYELWRDRYGENPDLVGGTVLLDDVSFQVVAILPRGFRLRSLGSFSRSATHHALWLPIGAHESSLDRGNHSYEALGRLRPDVSPERAGAEAASIIWADATPGTRGVRVVPRRDEEIGDSARPLFLLLGAVGLLLLIACANVATLVLGESIRRGRELATKAALGAGAGRILRQLALENALLGVAGAALGIVLARWGVEALLALAPADLALPESIALDLRVLGFAGGVGLAAGLAIGVLPGLLAGRRDLQRDLGPGSSGTGGARRSQRALVAAQVAVSLVLLAASALLARSFAELGAVDVGFDGRDVVTAHVSLPPARYSSPEEGALFFHAVVDRLEEAPGTVGATAVSAMPFSGRGGSSSFDLVGRDPPPDAPDPEAHRRTVLPSYHAVMDVPLLQGRYLEPSDRIEEAPAILVSESMARRYWPDGTALGSRILRDGREWEVVGVVADVLHSDLRSDPLPTFYLPLDVAEGRGDMTLVVRSELPAEQVAEQIRSTVWAVDPALPVEDVATASALIARSATDERFRTLLLSAFALLATALCAVGLFGVVARTVAARTSELGVRVALGARDSTLLGHVVAREVPPLAIGIVTGIAGVLATAELLDAFLFGVSPHDPVSLAGAVAVLGAAGLLAILAAARRALALDPVQAIRTE